MVAAAGIEPLLPVNTNPMTANDFGFYDMTTFELPHRFDSLESPPVPWSPPQSWRHFGDGINTAVLTGWWPFTPRPPAGAVTHCSGPVAKDEQGIVIPMRLQMERGRLFDVRRLHYFSLRARVASVPHPRTEALHGSNHP